VLPWLHMISISLLYRDAALPLTLRSLCLVIACTVIITATYAFAEDDFITSCDNQGFNNVYYLINKTDFSAVADFFLLNDLQFHFEKTYFSSVMGQRDRITTFYDFENMVLHNADKELVHTLDNNLPDYRVEKDQMQS